MKKALILTLATGIACAMTTMADTYDLFLTGSTAFRANVHDACKNLFDTTPTTGAGTLQYGGASSGGNGAANNGNAQWTMSGTSSKISALGTNTLVIHALFTGSVQGIQTVENSTKLIFLTATGGLMTNSPTVGFSDCASSSTIYDANNTVNFTEESVCVQPFVWVRAMNGSSLMTNINNISWDQAKYIISAGRMKLSAWTAKAADTSLIYCLQRTQDSGTRRVELANNGYGYQQGLTIYNYDATNNLYYLATNNGPCTITGVAGTSVVGSPGNGNNNLNWGPGYVGGGDLRTALNYANANNTSIGFLSFADAKTAGIASSNWSAVIPFNGIWPTAAGSGIWGNTGTNDFSPITRGMYPGYGNEVLVCPADGVDANSISGDQNLTFNLLGNDTTPGTILGVLNKKFNASTTPTAGSLEYTIETSKVTGATAIRFADMHTSRPSVGGTITP